MGSVLEWQGGLQDRSSGTKKVSEKLQPLTVADFKPLHRLSLSGSRGKLSTPPCPPALQAMTSLQKTAGADGSPP